MAERREWPPPRDNSGNTHHQHPIVLSSKFKLASSAPQYTTQPGGGIAPFCVIGWKQIGTMKGWVPGIRVRGGAIDSDGGGVQPSPGTPRRQEDM
jgi:hypothetical protein